MSLISGVVNKIQYLIAKNTSDPEAEAYAKQQAAQAAQDAAVRKQKAIADKKAAEAAADQEKKDQLADSLAARSKFNSKQLINQVTSGILTAVVSLVVLCFVFYGGHIAVNQAIGYNVPFRLLTFLYGVIFSIWVVPKALYDIYWKGIKLPYYGFLPISTYVPNGDLESIFLGPFCYIEDGSAITAKAAVETLYSNAFKKSVGMAITAAAIVGSVANRKNVPKAASNIPELPKLPPSPELPNPQLPPSPELPNPQLPSSPELPPKLKSLVEVLYDIESRYDKEVAEIKARHLAQQKDNPAQTPPKSLVEELYDIESRYEKELAEVKARHLAQQKDNPPPSDEFQSQEMAEVDAELIKRLKARGLPTEKLERYNKQSADIKASFLKWQKDNPPPTPPPELSQAPNPKELNPEQVIPPKPTDPKP